MTWTEWTQIVIFVIVCYFLLTALVALVRRYLKLDQTEREKILQAEVEKLKREVETYKKKVETLERQSEVFVEQYEETVGKLKKIEDLYKIAAKDNIDLRDQMERSSGPSQPRDTRPDRVLMVYKGSNDVGFNLDTATIRGVENDTGLEIQVIPDSSPDTLKKYLERARLKRNHIYLHLSVRADESGYQLGSQIVDANWLAGILNDVIILFVAGSGSDDVGDFITVVPYVLTMAGGVSHREAALFSRIFWTEIGKGIGPSMALKRAMDKSPNTVRDKIVSHWE